ncbi:MAG: DUF2334 domain-containing protein [Ignavibacteriales bacterium]|nr:DUF2334 domain-containing protein [Ignavibacteriales bacterium]
MKTRYIFLVFLLPHILFTRFSYSAEAKRVLILFEGKDVPTNYARGDARQLAMLLGHFKTEYKIEGVETYRSEEMKNYDITFFIGFSKQYDPPEKFLRDAYSPDKMLVWMNTGMEYFSRKYDLAKKYSIKFERLDTISNFDIVSAGGRNFTKGEPNINIINVLNQNNVDVIATAFSNATGREVPYIVRIDNFMYIADSPFASATETDRYIYFADMLHDLLDQPHEEKHRPLLRIEDVTVFENTERLRDVADALYSKYVPFLVGVVPFFVDPDRGTRVSLSDKPEMVDALHYMVSRGATIVMHGVTHQYQGTTATDFEFWDASTNQKLKEDSKDYVEKKIKMGLEEFWKNNLYPLVWETPHYTASQSDYPIFAKYFNTAMEQRCVLDDADYSQYFPYIIEKDLFGQRLLPENLGYIPLDEDREVEEDAVKKLLNGAKMQLAVRDGFASAFIHSFIDIRYIEEYVDGIKNLGYQFIDVKDLNLNVKLNNHLVITGSQAYSVKLDDQFYRRTIYQPDGEIESREESPERISGVVNNNISLQPRYMLVAEPLEFKEIELNWFDKLKGDVKKIWEDVSKPEIDFDDARVAILWDDNAKDVSYNNQSSFASAFRSININVDTLPSSSLPSLDLYNLLIVPYNNVELLLDKDYDKIVNFLETGGNVITDGKNDLADELGIKFAGSKIKIEKMRDRLYPSDPLMLKTPEMMTRFDYLPNDKILCVEEKIDAPVVLGKNYGKGKFIFFGIRFDPISKDGYSRFPYLIEYVRSFFHLSPILRRENLEVYYDAGYRHNVSIEDLVKRWVADGIRAVHAVGWHQYEKWTYDYERLVELCHANGILVYAWLEPPHVSEKFWKDHPEWQEKNFRGEPVKASWRFPVALTDTACFSEVKNMYRSFLERYDWDGVNIAELYFEAGVDGPENSNLMTPMHPSARTEFQSHHGFDPALLFDEKSAYYWKNNVRAWNLFEEYRVAKLIQFHDSFLSMVDELKFKKPHLDVVVTVMDNIGNPELRKNHGVDAIKINELKKKYLFTLQIEDPQSEWSKDPKRYQLIGAKYDSLLGKKNSVMLDLNILQFRDEKKPTIFPSLIQTGIESYQLVRSSALGADRYSLYSESSIRPQDLRMMSYAASANALITYTGNGWRIQSPHPVVLELPRRYFAVQTESGERYTTESGKFFIPAGIHLLKPEIRTNETFNIAPPASGQLLSISGELVEIQNSNRSVEILYRSDTRCYTSFSHKPYSIFLDGNELKTKILEGYRRYTVVLPPGEHRMLAVLETTVSYSVDLTSFWSSWFIVAFGMLSGTLLMGFYVIVRFSRSRKENQ